MTENVVGTAAIGQHDVVEEFFEVGDVVVETDDIAARRVPDQALRAALAAPIQDGGSETARRQIADGLEIFLDAFVAAGENDDRALEEAGLRRGKGVADRAAVIRREMGNPAPFGG